MHQFIAAQGESWVSTRSSGAVRSSSSPTSTAAAASSATRHWSASGVTYVATRPGDPVAFGNADRAFKSDVAKSDLDILNYALTLEYLEAAFYTAGLKAKLLKGRELELIDPIQQHEADHVKAVRTTITDLGGRPVAQPKVKFPDGTFSNRANFLKTAGVFEELGVKAYHGQVPLVKNPDLLGGGRVDRRCRVPARRDHRPDHRREPVPGTDRGQPGDGAGPQGRHALHREVGGAADDRHDSGPDPRQRLRSTGRCSARCPEQRVPAGQREGLQQRHRSTELRADAGVPRGRVLSPGQQARIWSPARRSST